MLVGFPGKRALTGVRAGSEKVTQAPGALHLLPLLGQLVFAGDDLHCVRLSIALVLDESHRTVWPHLPCKAGPVFKHVCTLRTCAVMRNRVG